MSTRYTIKWREPSAGLPGFCLFEEVFEAPGPDGELPVYLHLHGVGVELETMDESGAAVTLKMPRASARELGLLQPPDGSNLAVKRSPSEGR